MFRWSETLDCLTIFTRLYATRETSICSPTGTRGSEQFQSRVFKGEHL